jgi:hypothetical protein
MQAFFQSNVPIKVLMPDGPMEMPDEAAKAPVAERASTHNLVPVMDLDRGIVGRDSEDDPASHK